MSGEKWQGKLFIINDKQEFMSWKSPDNIGSKIMTFGSLFTAFFKKDLSKAEQVKELLEEWGNPPVYDSEGQIVTDSKITATLQKEKEYLQSYIENIYPRHDKQMGYSNTNNDINNVKGLDLINFLKDTIPLRANKIILALWNEQDEEEVIKSCEYKKLIDTVKKISKDILYKQNILQNNISSLWVPDIIEEKALIEQQIDNLYKLYKERADIQYKLFNFLIPPVFKFLTPDIFTLIWAELFFAREQNAEISKCQVCGNYFVNSIRRDRMTCFSCNYPSKQPIASRDPEEQKNIRLRNTIHRQYNRGSISIEEANQKLSGLGLRKIKPRESQKC